MSLIYDPQRGAYIVESTGEVVEEEPYESVPTARGDDYDEWARKLGRAVMFDQKTRKLYSMVRRVASEVGIGPDHFLVNEAVEFFKKCANAKLEVEVGKRLYPSNRKCVLAVLKVLAEVYSLNTVSQVIGSHMCGQSQCMASKRRSDREFKKFYMAAVQYARRIYGIPLAPPTSRENIERLAREGVIPRDIAEEASGICSEYSPYLSGSPKVSAVACIYIAARRRYRPQYAMAVARASAAVLGCSAEIALKKAENFLAP